MHYRADDDSTTDKDEWRFKNVSVKRITEIEALWRINAEGDALSLQEAEVRLGSWKLAA